MIPKRGKDHSKTKGCRPINLINCIGKLGEKVVADRLQESGLLRRQTPRVRPTTQTPIRIRQRQIGYESSPKGGDEGSEMHGGRRSGGMELLGCEERIPEC